MRKRFIAGNWKMHKTIAEAKSFADNFRANLGALNSNTEVAICAPFTQLSTLVKEFEGTSVKVGAQNFFYEDKGAYTGEISLPMLKELDLDYVIIGHSERREYFAESNGTVNLKLKRVLEDDRIKPIVCVGESLEVREAGEAKSFVEEQIIAALKDIDKSKMDKVVIAYEPIWAIGTGKTASSQQAQEMCKVIRDKICELYGKAVAESILIQYGGSVKPANADEILSMEDIDGALVGGASLKPEEVLGILGL